MDDRMMTYEDFIKAVQAGTYVFSADTDAELNDIFVGIYPDVSKACWGYKTFNWDNARKSILIDYGKGGGQSHVLFEISRNPVDNKWTGMRCLLIPKGVDAT